MSGEKQESIGLEQKAADEINIGGASAQVIKLDGGPEGLAAFLGELFGSMQNKMPSGAEMLSSIEPALPGDSPEDAEWKEKHLTRLRQFAEELAQLDFARIDTMVVAYRLHEPAVQEDKQEGFYIGGGHLGTQEAIEALLVFAHERLKAEVNRDYDQAEHERRLAAGEKPCGGCGHFHD